jgi:hypothetical protein
MISEEAPQGDSNELERKFSCGEFEGEAVQYIHYGNGAKTDF